MRESTHDLHSWAEPASIETPDGPPFLVVAPGASGLARARRREEIVRAASRAIRDRCGADPRVHVTGSAAEGRAVAREAVAAGARLAVVAGGDGSVRTAAAILAGTGIPLGVIPAGTGNLLAAALAIPRSPERAIAALAGARLRHLDMGSATLGGSAPGAAAGHAPGAYAGHAPGAYAGHAPGAAGPDAAAAAKPAGPSADAPIPFLVAAGIGFDARVMASTTDRRKRSLGIAAYFASAVAVAVRMRPFEVRIIVDGVAHETDALAVLVANAGELVPGLLRPRLPLVPDDGVLDVLVARGSGPVGGSRAAIELMLGRGIHTAIGPFATRFVGRRIEITTDVAEPIEVDGDVVGSGSLLVEVRPAVLRVLVPR